jgi:hypothetical protein
MVSLYGRTPQEVRKPCDANINNRGRLALAMESTSWLSIEAAERVEQNVGGMGEGETEQKEECRGDSW